MLQHRQHVINEIRTHAEKISAHTPNDPLFVTVIAPGPPGVGKTRASLELLADNNIGRLVSPSHELAKERHGELKKLLKDTGRANIVPRHLVGMGRKCLYLPEDKWAAVGWSFSVAACDACPSKKQCPGTRQHWQHTDIVLGVHTMANWAKPGILIIDELPTTVNTRTYSSTELARIGANIWHPKLEGWRQGFADAWNRVLNKIEDAAIACTSPKVWGTTVYLDDTFPPGSSERADLDFLCDYFEAQPTPAPPSSSVRGGTLTPDKWIAGDLETCLRTLRWESDGVSVADRASAGLPLTLCIRVYGDNQGKFVDYQLEHRQRWIPPSRPHMILDSTAPLSREVYSKLYQNHAIVESFSVVPLPVQHLDLQHYDTLGFARSRSLSLSRRLLKPGTFARIRAIRHLIYNVRQLRTSRFNKIQVGIIDHKGLLEAIGYDFHNESVLTPGNNGRKRLAPDPLLEAAWSELESMAELIVGYHGGVTGSNLFNNVRILSIHGDPTGHIGMLAENARTLDMDAVAHFRWSVAINATQEIFRARLLDASPTNPKTVLYFGHYAPDLTAMGAYWTVNQWTDGGRLPSLLSHAFAGAIWEQVGMQRFPIIGVLLPEFAGLHATLIGTALYALRATEESWDATSPKTRECYRRTAKVVADALGFRTFYVPHPFGSRKPIPVHAANLAEAVDAFNEVKDYLLSTPAWRVQDFEDVAARAEMQRQSDEQVCGEVESIKAAMQTAKIAYNDGLNHANMQHLTEAAKYDASNPADAVHVEAAELRYDTTQDQLKQTYKAAMRAAIVRWRVVKKAYKATQSVLAVPADVLKFAHKGIVL